MGACTSATAAHPVFSNDSSARVKEAPIQTAPAPDFVAPSRAGHADEASKDAGIITRAQFILDNRGAIDKSYSLENDKLGEGAYGFVCRASDKTTGVVRAVKKIRQASVTDVKAFRQEVTHMKAMDHPNIIRLFETFEDKRNVYLVMELCEGGELFDRVAALRRLPEGDVRVVMQDVLRAVHYMHGKDVAHRDLKPENFLLQAKGPIAGNVLKLIDFGTATACSSRKMMSTKVGTSFYIAPQVLQRRYGRECDLWSAGAMMFVLISGSPPFPGSTDREVLAKVRRGTYSFSATPWDHTSQEAQELVRMLMHINPIARYSTQKALDHKWTQRDTVRPAPSLGEYDVEQIIAYSGQNKLKKCALQIIAGQLKDTQLKPLRDQFISLDSNNDGILTAQELKLGIEQAGIQRSPAEVDRILQSMDVDGNGLVNYTEFLAAGLDRGSYLDKDACWTAFNVFDRDGDGVISLKELEVRLNSPSRIKHGSKKQHVKNLLQEVDRDGDGLISFEEFMGMMSGGDPEDDGAPSVSVAVAQGGA